MEITIKDLENNLKTLPKELLGNVNDYIDFLKEKYLSKKEEFLVPEWQKEETRKRASFLQEHPESIVSETEMNTFLNELEDEL